jgi:ATP-dependent Clp protease ATP-binding subunit ClpC
LKELSVGLHMAWQVAAGEAAAAKHQYIEKEHMLIGICSLEKLFSLGEEKTGLTEQARQTLQAENENIDNVLRGFELEATQLRRQLRETLGQGSYKNTEKVIHRSENCKQLFNRAGTLAASANEICCLHFITAIMEQPGDIINSVLEEKGVKPAALGQRALTAAVAGGQEAEVEQVQAGKQEKPESDTHYLDRYGRDLTKDAKEGKLGPFIGRRGELLQLIQTLARKTKNNPVLVGEAGVGKTAIVEALALRVSQGKDPEVLEGKRIIELNVGNLVAGTKFRGEFEQRLSGILAEACSHREIIVFIDEIHNLIGAGKAEGSMDAANLMKPALARGDIRCIGATTITEYRRYIESDSALERRFEKIIVNEPSPEEALEILKGLRPKLEEHHRVQIADSALEAAVNLSIRFDGDHQLPDKAIDLIDKSSARTRIPILSMGPHRKEKAQSKENGKLEPKTSVTDLTVAQVLSNKIGVPLEIITGHLEGMEQSRLLELESFLKQRLIGQNEAVDCVNQRLLLAHSGLGKRRGPLAVFMFLGPTGVGKTELAKLLAEFLFGNKSDMIRLDMSEYMEEHSGAKLIGSPPGYVGYEQEGQLTGKLRTNPYSVVLLDEVEKAHPRVFDMFLQVFDDGRMTDAKGRTIDARNAIFVMTSNINAGNLNETPPIYDGRRRVVGVREKLKRIMRPEFINRIDEIIEFQALGENEVKRILKPMLQEICLNLQKQQGITLEIDEDAESYLARAGYNSDFGVRELQRTVERLIQIPLSRLILSGEMKKHIQWKITYYSQGLAIVPVGKDTGKGSHETERI